MRKFMPSCCSPTRLQKGSASMSLFETEQTSPHAGPVLSNCPQCDADLAVLRVIGGRAGGEYWTLRCTRCGGIHFHLQQASPPPAAQVSVLSTSLHPRSRPQNSLECRLTPSLVLRAASL